ncbi:RrF2 family transcriptional regulator [Nocardia sp. NPDC058658]|uniref:RrF2 family transcriptional regulator n=1 Tax=unclassified Nocardia TaxID=2637762 RepID=UPI00364A4D9B
MQLAPTTDIALRAVMRLAVGETEDARITIGLIARSVGASERIVARAVTLLTGFGLVEVQRGRSGGLTLTPAGHTIRIGELIRLLEDDREVVECTGDRPCPLIAGCRLRRALADATAAFYAVLDEYTVESMVAGPSAQLLRLLAVTPARTPEENEDTP